jgi:hypothetical protein
LDSKYRGADGHDDTGRFIPYVYRGSSGIALSPLAGYEEEGTGDYYLLPKETLEETIVDPFLYPLNGEDKLMTSIVLPLTSGGRFVGIVGMDILVDTLIEQNQRREAVPYRLHVYHGIPRERYFTTRRATLWGRRFIPSSGRRGRACKSCFGDGREGSTSTRFPS